MIEHARGDGTLMLHQNEFAIDDELVQRLLDTQMPDLARLRLQRVESSGTANVMYRLGADLVVRLPRTEEFARGPQREARWLPLFTGVLPIHVPAYRRLGVPSDEYPSHWSILEWIAGDVADEHTIAGMVQPGVQLGEFVRALREVPTIPAPGGGSYRAFGLAMMDSPFRTWVAELPDDIDRAAVTAIWEKCVEAGAWEGEASWVHTDLRGDNLVARDGRFVGVIDWEGCTVGDPSADHLAAWWLFTGDNREDFRVASHVDRNSWRRAMGWALFMSVAAIPYYSDTNAAFARQARRALNEILVDEEPG